MKTCNKRRNAIEWLALLTTVTGSMVRLHTKITIKKLFLLKL